MRFSERQGYKQVSKIIQHDGMNDSLRNGLWNVIYEFFLGSSKGRRRFQGDNTILQHFVRTFWKDYLKNL